MNRLFNIGIVFVGFLVLPYSAVAAPKILKELTGVKLTAVTRQVFEMPGSFLTLAEESFVVAKPAICYGAKARRICRVALAYPTEDDAESSAVSLQQAVMLTYNNPSPPGAALTIISAIRYF